MGFHHKMTTQESAKSIISNQSIESNATYTCTCGISSNSSGNITKNRDAKNLMENSCSHKNNILNFKNHNRGKLVKQIFLYLLGILSFIPCGASIGWSSNYLFGHWNNSQFLHSSTSWIVASLPFSAAFTSLSLVKLFRKLGIRVLLFASTTIMSLSWTFILIESYHSSILLIGRILNGIGIATIFTIIPIYLQDLMPTKHRKRIGNVMYAATIVGVLLEYINDFYPTKNSSTILMIIISILPTIGFIFFPESPQSLVRNQNYVDARNILEQFIPNENCDEIIGKMQNWTIAEQRDDEKFAVVFRNRSWIERLIPLFGLVIFDTLLSVTVILFYLKPIVFALGESVLSVNIQIIIICVGMLLGISLKSCLQCRLAPKSSLIISIILISLTYFVLGTYFHTTHLGISFLSDNYPYIPVICFTSNVLLYTSGVASNIRTYLYVLTSQHNRFVVQTTTQTISWLITGILCAELNHVIWYIGIGWFFYNLAIIGLFMVSFIILLMPRLIKDVMVIDVASDGSELSSSGSSVRSKISITDSTSTDVTMDNVLVV